MSIDFYCQDEGGKFHQNSYFGTENCNQDDAAILANEMSATSGACLGLPGTAMMYECVLCSEHVESENSLSSQIMKETWMNVYHGMQQPLLAQSQSYLRSK